MKKYNLPAGGVGYHWESNKEDPGYYVDDKKELVADASEPAGSTLHLPLSGFIDVTFDQGQSPLQHSTPNHDARFNFNNSPWSSSSDVPRVLPLKSVYEGMDDATVILTGGRDTEFSNNGFYNLLHATFSRASNLVREGMEVDGAVYFDAPSRFYQGRSTLETDPRVRQPEASDFLDESDTDGSFEVRPGPRPLSRASKHHGLGQAIQENTSQNDNIGLNSEILRFSTSSSSSWNKQSANTCTSFSAIDQNLLTSLVRRYPKGELFVFDEDGPIEPLPAVVVTEATQRTLNSANVEEKRLRRQARKRAESPLGRISRCSTNIFCSIA